MNKKYSNVQNNNDTIMFHVFKMPLCCFVITILGKPWTHAQKEVKSSLHLPRYESFNAF